MNCWQTKKLHLHSYNCTSCLILQSLIFIKFCCLYEWNSTSVTVTGGGNVLKDRVVRGQAMSLFPSQLLSATDARFSQNSQKSFLQLGHCWQPLAVTAALIINTISPQAWTDIINIHLRSDISPQKPVFTHNTPNQYISHKLALQKNEC